MVNLLSFLVGLLNSKTKAKPSGLPDSNFIFFVATKKTKQKKALRCAGHVWFVKAAASIQGILTDQKSTLPPQDSRLLRTSSFLENCIGSFVITLFPCKPHRKGNPP